jgi:histidyl-tRNA synthetase
VSLKAPRGTQDILPGTSEAWEFVERRACEVLVRYGYGEIRTPVFERTELFQRGVGESTDIVQKEMYTFPDRKGRSLTLRPEGTAPVARAFVEHKLFAGTKPVKLYYLGPMFRYERPQAGRYRQHHQIGAELLGSEAPAADFESIALLVDIYTAVGLRGLTVMVNSVGDAACRPQFSETLRTYLLEHRDALCPDCVRRTELNPLRVLDCKVPGCREVAKDIPSIQEHLCDACRLHQTRVLALLEAAGIACTVNDRLVRGLDYYTRTVFEVQHDGLGAQNAIGGGGRYDRLVDEVGGPETPGVGFSTGIERILLALQADGAPVPGARRLRGRFRVEADLLDRGLGAQMKAANKLGAKVVVVVGPDEMANGRWTVKDMASGEQEAVADAALEARLAELLDSPRNTA